MAIEIEEDTLFQALLGGGTEVIYNVPDGHRAVIRSLWVINDGNANRSFKLYMRKNPEESLGRVHSVTPYLTIGAGKLDFFDGFKALGPKGQILGEVSAGGDVVVVAWGALIKS